MRAAWPPERVSFRDYIAGEVRKLATPAAQQAIANLLALSPLVIGDLADEFWQARDPDIRAGIVFVIAQFGDEGALDFLIGALDDVHDAAWVNALDGIVNIGTPAAVRRLTAFMVSLNPDDIRGAWTMEAIEQMSQAPS